MKLEELDNIPDIHDKAINYVFENNLVKEDGLWLEFGVHAGGTINRIAAYTKKTVYGFDSFEGLPENWEGRVEQNGVTYPKGTFSLGGWMPETLPNVRLIKGWFKDSIKEFKKYNDESIAFLHIDSDIYSSAKDIFNLLGNKIKPGCIIVFDELVGYPGFEKHEWKAWWEWVEQHGIKYKWIGGNKSKQIIKNNTVPAFDRTKRADENVSPSHENVAVEILDNPSYIG